MATDIRVPALGESVSEATIGRWFKKPGEAVKADEPLVELETDKVTVEVPSPASGTLSAIAVKEGETIAAGGVLGTIAEGVTSEEMLKPSVQPSARTAISSTSSSTTLPGPTISAPVQPSARTAISSSTSIHPAPSAQKRMAEAGISLESGSGKRGQVLKEDVLAALAAPAAVPTAPLAARPSAPADDAAREERVRMSKLRQTIARRLKDAQNVAAMLTTFNEADMSAIISLRNSYKDLFEKKHGIKLGFMGFFVKACIQALKEIPAVNAEIDGQDIIYKNYYHIGVAVGTDKGLVVPVVRDADLLSIAGIEKKIADFGRRARDGQLKIEEMQGGTFTLSNGGIYGSLMSTPILNAPQAGILGMHKIQERPVAIAGKVEIRPMMYLALSYDHRLVDGKEAVTFLVRVKEGLENPERLVLDL